MALVRVLQPEVITIEYTQEKSDSDYGSCLWARFNFDTRNYSLTIFSDCGNYTYEWAPTPEVESFLKLMSRVNGDYLLDKISSTSVVDGDETWKNVQEYINNVLDGEEPDFSLLEVENVCYYCSTSEVYNALLDSLRYTNANNDYADDYALLQCIEQTYPHAAKKIVEIFMNHIQPKIKLYLESEGENNENYG